MKTLILNFKNNYYRRFFYRKCQIKFLTSIKPLTIIKVKKLHYIDINLFYKLFLCFL